MTTNRNDGSSDNKDDNSKDKDDDADDDDDDDDVLIRQTMNHYLNLLTANP